MTVLVAGGTGFLGTAVVRELIHADLFEAERVEEATSAVDGLEAVGNLVGGYSDGPRVHETEPDDFERMWRLNVMPGFLLARAAMPKLIERGGGAFVGVSARPALRPFPGAAGYISSKAAVLALIQALDAEYKNDGVRCNAILPSVIDTPANREAMPNADHSKWVAPADIARVIRFLVSDDSAPTSGAAIPVYGRA